MKPKLAVAKQGSGVERVRLSPVRSIVALVGVGVCVYWFVWRFFLAMFGMIELNSFIERDRYISDFILAPDLLVTIERSTTHPNLFAREPHYTVRAIARDGENTVRAACDVTDAVRHWEATTCAGYELNFGNLPFGALGMGNQLWW